MIIFENEINAKADFELEELANEVVEVCVDMLDCPYDVEVGLTIVDNKTMREINLEQRNIDNTTDVLSFPMNEYNIPGVFIEDELCYNYGTGNLILGDIVINFDKVIEQADEYGHSIKREYVFLIVHSILHLVGYDHMLEVELKEMFKIQDEIMEGLGISR